MSEEQTTDEHEDPEGDTFPRAYVEKLRAEAAQHRQTAKAEAERAEALARRLLVATVERAAAGILADPTDLLALADTADLVGDDGLPDADAIRATATALVDAKPHLGDTRPRGDVDQGPRGDPAEGPGLAAMLRARAG